MGYHVYGNTGAGDPIDYASILATTTGLTTTAGPLEAPGTWSFGVRAYNGYGEDANVDASVTIAVDASGRDVSAMPAAPVALAAVAGPAGSVAVHWGYPLASPGRAPTGFHVYQGLGAVDYSAPVATVVAAAGVVQSYSASPSGLSAGTWSFGVRAYNATGEESNTLTATAVIRGSSPMAVQGFTATAVSG